VQGGPHWDASGLWVATQQAPLLRGQTNRIMVNETAALRYCAAPLQAKPPELRPSTSLLVRPTLQPPWRNQMPQLAAQRLPSFLLQ